MQYRNAFHGLSFSSFSFDLFFIQKKKMFMMISLKTTKKKKERN